MDKELEPCPFCGGPAVIANSYYRGTGASGMETPHPYAACVKGCVKMRPIHCDDWQPKKARNNRRYPFYNEAKAEAIAAWNTRPTNTREQVLREALERARPLVEQAKPSHGVNCSILDPGYYGDECSCGAAKEWPKIDGLLAKIDQALQETHSDG